MGSGSGLEIRGVSALLRSFALLRSTEISPLRNRGLDLNLGLGIIPYGQSPASAPSLGPRLVPGLAPDLDHLTLALAFVPGHPL